MNHLKDFNSVNNEIIAKPGDYVRLIHMVDQYAPPSGTIGLVNSIDDLGHVMVTWENGSSLSIIHGFDQYEILSKYEVEKYIKTQEFNI